MSRNSATIRYYILVGAYSQSIGLLLLSVFVGLKYLNSASMVWGQAYLGWILGFGLGGLILFSGTLIVEICWRHSQLVARPELPEEQYKLLMISIASGIILLASLLTGMLVVGFSAGAFGVCLLVPFVILLWLFSAVRFVFKFEGAGLALLVNSIFLGLAILLHWTNRNLEFGFRWRLRGYEAVVRLVETRYCGRMMAGLPRCRQIISGFQIVMKLSSLIEKT